MPSALNNGLLLASRICRSKTTPRAPGHIIYALQQRPHGTDVARAARRCSAPLSHARYPVLAHMVTSIRC